MRSCASDSRRESFACPSSRCGRRPRPPWIRRSSGPAFLPPRERAADLSVTPIPILLYGASGRMGQAVRAVAAEFPDVRLAACVSRSPAAGGGPEGCAWMTPDQLFSGGGSSLPAETVVIDVSLPEGTARLLDWLERSPRPLVSAPTGLEDHVEKRIGALATRAPVLRATNLSLGNAVARAMLRSVPEAARGLFDVDIVEHHHATKRDAPSGTARTWAALVASRPDAIHSI